MNVYQENDGLPITSGQYYSTMIINAQTGEFMDPIKLKENLLTCPNIITWEDAKWYEAIIKEATAKLNFPEKQYRKHIKNSTDTKNSGIFE